MRLKNLFAFSSLFLVIIFLYHQKAFFAPNDYFFGGTGDAYKNYYTGQYFVQHDSTYSSFRGMLYPYSTQIIFTDNQPSLAISLKFLENLGFNIADYTVGVFNLAILLNLLLAPIFIFLSLRLLKVPFWPAIIAAFAIGMLSPQWYRANQHYALAYTAIIPAVIWLFLLYTQHKRVSLLLATGGFIFIASLLHLYFLPIAGGLFGLAALLYHPPIGRNALHNALWCLGVLVLALLLPFALIKGWLYFTDPYANLPRIENPYGFKAYYNSISGFIFPFEFDWFDHVEAQLKPHLDVRPDPFRWIQKQYLGLLAILVLLGAFASLAARQVAKLARIASFNSSIVLPRALLALWVASVVMAIFSLAPYKNLPDIYTAKLGPLQQFRDVSRFGWPLFYVANIIAVFFLFRQLATQHAITRYSLQAVLLGLLIWDAHNLQQRKLYGLAKNDFQYNSDVRLAFRNSGVQFTDFQAVLTVPYMHQGAEAFADQLFRDGVIELHSTIYGISLESGLPLISYNLSRIPLELAFDSFGFMFYDTQKPEVLNKLSSDKPFLLLEFKSLLIEHQLQAENFKDAEILHETPKWYLKKVPVAYYDSIRTKLVTLAHTLAALPKASLPDTAITLLDARANGLFVSSALQKGDTSLMFATPGEFARPAGIEMNRIFDFGDSSVFEPGTYTISFWMKIEAQAQYNTGFYIYHKDAETGETSPTVRTYLANFARAKAGDWHLLEFNIQFDKRVRNLHLYVDQPPAELHFDNLLVRKFRQNVFHQQGNTIFLNNRFISAEEKP